MPNLSQLEILRKTVTFETFTSSLNQETIMKSEIINQLSKEKLWNKKKLP